MIIIQVDKLIKETEDAYYLNCEGDKVWFPKSKVKLDLKNNELELPIWLAKLKFPNEF